MKNQKQLSSTGWLVSISLTPPHNPPPCQHHLGIGGYRGSQILWIAPACQELTDPFFFLFCQRSDSLSRQEKEKRMPGETQVELSHTCFGTDCDLFALLSLVWNSRRTWHTAGTGASETTWVKSICAGLLFGPLTTLGWHSKIIHEIYEHCLQWWCANGMALAKQSQSESRICPVIHMWAVLVINLLLLQFVNSNTDKYEKKK